jgi:DNA-binding CsgD family transcriptional regulator
MRMDSEALTAEILRRVNAAGLSGMILLDDPSIASIIRLETGLVVAAVLRALDAPAAEDVHPPAECRHSARLAAKHGVPLEAVTKAYRIGHRVMQDAVIERGGSDPTGTSLARLQRLFVVLDVLIDVICAEYELELRVLAEKSSDSARLRSVQRVLRDATPTASLPFYSLPRRHTAVVATGPIREPLGKLVNARPGARMAVDADDDLCWSWFADLGPEEVTEALRRSGSFGAAGVGGPASGAEGFRLAHQQAALARQVAAVSQHTVAGYWEAGVTAIGLASRAESRVLVLEQLGDLHLDTPRNRELRRTLEAYAESGHRVRSTATALGVSERTVSNRLATANRVLPATTKPLSLELALALRLRATLGDTLWER